MSDALWTPTVDDVLAIHEHVVAEYDATEPGVRNEGAISFAVDRVAAGPQRATGKRSTRRRSNCSDCRSTITRSSMRTNEPRWTLSRRSTSSTAIGSNTIRGSDGSSRRSLPTNRESAGTRSSSICGLERYRSTRTKRFVRSVRISSSTGSPAIGTSVNSHHDRYSGSAGIHEHEHGIGRRGADDRGRSRHGRHPRGTRPPCRADGPGTKPGALRRARRRIAPLRVTVLAKAR